VPSWFLSDQFVILTSPSKNPLKPVMGNPPCPPQGGMGNGELGIGNGELGMENGELGMENGE